MELLESGTKSFLVMEAVNGKSIGQRMRKGERFSSREILKTGIALSGILCYLHAQNPPVFYRDLKPDNVMITERGEIYLVDFGAAGTEETGVEVRYGTRGYAAPEQYNGKCDARSDLYALGALLAAMAKHAKKRQKRGLWRVMEKCMQKKPEERYASAREVKKALRRLERKQKGRKTLRIFAVFAFLTGGAAAVASRMPWGQFPAADEWEEQGDLWFCGNPVEEGSLPNYQKAREAFLKADHLSQAGRVEQELVEYCLADDAAREKMQMEPLLAEFYDDTQQEPEKEKRCRRYLAVAGMYFSFSEELARENDTDAMRKGIEVLEKAAGENMEGKWEAVIWQRLADACYLGGKSGDGEREQDWCQESFLYYERLLCSRQDGNRRKNLLRAAELALQFDMQEKTEPQRGSRNSGNGGGHFLSADQKKMGGSRMRKKTICAMMTGFLAVQGIEVHAETQQTTGEAASAVESVELEAEIIENSDVTDADGKAGPEELLPDEKSEEEPPIEEKPEQEPEPPEEKTDPAETGKKETEEEKMLPPTVIPDPEKEPAERWEETDTKESGTEESDSERTDFGEMDTEKPDYEDAGSEKSGTENLMPEDSEPEKPDMEETKQESPSTEKESENQTSETKAPEKEEPTVMPDAGKANTEKQEQTEPGQSSPEKEELKTDEQLPVAAATPEEVTQDPDDTPLQTEESSPPPAETPSESAGEEPSQIPPQIIADFILSQIADEDFEAPNPLIIRPADTSVEIDPGYTPEILLEGAADTAEILSCMVNGSEAEYEWKENKICLKAESLSEGYNRITVKVRGADGIVRTMKPWEVNVKPKTSTLVSQRTSQKPKGTHLLQSLRRLWNLIRAIAEIQNQTTRYLRALCRK